MIQSLLDNDLYTFTQQQLILHKHPGVRVRYKFKCRNATPIDFSICIKEINAGIDDLCELRFTPSELDYLSGLAFVKPDYIDFLRYFQLNRGDVNASIDKDGILAIEITGSWLNTIPFEVPILAIVNEAYFKAITADSLEVVFREGMSRLDAKIAELNSRGAGVDIVEFGTRRRFSGKWQRTVLDRLLTKTNNISGTSNVLLAKDFGITPVGTMSHQLFMAYQALAPLRECQKAALQAWADEYRGHLGIALSDTYGFDSFLRDFDLYFCKLYDGARHDSGCPYEWCNKLLNHYRSYSLDPRTKTAVFSDGLTILKSIDIFETFGRDIQTKYGIGTHLTNDMGIDPLQIVIKLVECMGQPVAKESDSPGKGMCNSDTYRSYLRETMVVN